MPDYKKEIERRRTFAIISHPDAGKTTLTEKLLLYGGAIQLAGSVKGKATARHAVSDWMELEKQRGISITSSVMQFEYEGYCINILDTPGHQDFSEDTTPPRASSRRPESSSKSAPCGTSPSSPSSTSSTARREAPMISWRSWSGSSASAPTR